MKIPKSINKGQYRKGNIKAQTKRGKVMKFTMALFFILLVALLVLDPVKQWDEYKDLKDAIDEIERI